jgi:hypothetical protein
MGDYIQPTDLAEALPALSAPRILELISDVEAFAKIKAPGITSATVTGNAAKMTAVKAVLRAAIIYDATATDGFNEATDPRPVRSSVMLSPSQIETLRSLYGGTVAVNGVYSLPLGVPDTLPRY